MKVYEESFDSAILRSQVRALQRASYFLHYCNYALESVFAFASTYLQRIYAIKE